MTKLVLMRGYPGSGKTTIARDVYVRTLGYVRLSRDAVRAAQFGDDQSARLDHETESLITKTLEEQARFWLRQGRGVVIDDLNLRLRYARAWANLAKAEGVEFWVHDQKTDVEECVRRCNKRAASGGRLVGEPAVREIAKKFPLERWPKVEADDRSATGEVYVQPSFYGAGKAYLVDIDGTLARNVGRGFYDWARVGEDEGHEDVIDLTWRLGAGAKIILVSGRSDESREDTEIWLRENGVSYDQLWMRKAGDMRKDTVVKYELFDQNIRPQGLRILGVFDDRDSVVAMWRDVLGLRCYQVAPGNF